MFRVQLYMYTMESVRNVLACEYITVIIISYLLDLVRLAIFFDTTILKCCFPFK